MDAIIGHTGFVGSNIIEKMSFDYKYNSENINEISNYEYELVVCSGIPSLKWYANKHPKEDWENINQLINYLRDVKCNNFVLISTIDVHEKTHNNPNNIKCDENHHPYGYNRYRAEIEIEKIFGDKLIIIRLPSVFGNNLKKNVLYDLINNNLRGKINLCDKYQWYDVRCLGNDIDFVLRRNIMEINLFSAPVMMKEIVDEFFPNMDSGNFYYDCENVMIYDLNAAYDFFNYWCDKNSIMMKLKNHITQ